MRDIINIAKYQYRRLNLKRILLCKFEYIKGNVVYDTI